jgi:hypothetical protein
VETALMLADLLSLPVVMYVMCVCCADAGVCVVAVCRMLLDGDVMLTNRQPTLHKPSLMAHK